MAKVVIIEPQMDSAEKLQKAVLGLNHQIVGIFTSIQPALTWVQQNIVDLIFMDINCSEKLKPVQKDTEESYFNVPVLLILNDHQNSPPAHVQRQYPAGYISKPFENREIQKAIDTTLFICQLNATHNDSLKHLKEIENNFQILSQLSSEGIVLHKDGKLRYANDRYFQIFGYTTNDLKRIDALEKTMDIESLEKTRIRIQNNDTSAYEAVGVKKDGTRFPIQIFPAITTYNGEKLRAVIIRDLTDRKTFEEKIKNQTRRLEEINTALKVLIEHREKERDQSNKKLAETLEKLVLPYIDKIESNCRQNELLTYIEIVRANLQNVLYPLKTQSTLLNRKLTPSELEVSCLLQQGKTSKEIAEHMNISIPAVSFHRQNIRKKLKLTRKKINLKSYLISIKYQ